VAFGDGFCKGKVAFEASLGLVHLAAVTKKTDAANACQEAKRLAAKLVMVSLEP
jgi:hypothetical protein